MNLDNSSELEGAVAAAINAAEEVSEQQVEATQKPRLLIEPSSPDRTVAALRDILARTQIYERGAPVRIVRDQTVGGVVARPDHAGRIGAPGSSNVPAPRMENEERKAR